MNRRTITLSLAILCVLLLAAIGGVRITFNPPPAQAQNTNQSDNATMTCPKCKSAMAAGFLRDYFDTNSYDHAVWSPAGERQHLFSQGQKANVTVYRCTNCGYLEAYAK